MGISGGCEGLIHATRKYVGGMGPSKAFIKVDFVNAFNTLRRDAMLEAVSRLRPDLLEFVFSAYGETSHLWTGDTVMKSAEGVQQGDPLGPLLFCLTLDAPLKSVQSEYATAYLDDVGMGDTVPRLIEHMRAFEVAASSVGLHLNQPKCEIVGLDESQRPAWETSGFSFVVRPTEESTFLGSPLTVSGTSNSLAECRHQLVKGRSRLLLMQAHEAFYLLVNSLGIPRLQFLLRTVPCSLSDELGPLDEELRLTLEAITNVRLSPTA